MYSYIGVEQVPSRISGMDLYIKFWNLHQP